MNIKYINLLKPIGTGSFGIVYVGNNAEDNSRVAIKVFSPFLDSFFTLTDRSRLDKFRGEFLEECKRHVRTKHINVVEAFDVNTVGKDTFLVMEFVPNSLAKRLRDRKNVLRKIPLIEAMDIVLQLCDAIEYIFLNTHGGVLAHRDIRDANILIDGNGYVKVGDLGLSKNLVHLQNKADAEIYSMPIVAPEQVGINGKASSATDLWAVGLLFYQMLSGKRPFIFSNIVFKTGEKEQSLSQSVSFGEQWVRDPLLVIQKIKDENFAPEIEELILRLISDESMRLQTSVQLKKFINDKSVEESELGAVVKRLGTLQERREFSEKIKETKKQASNLGKNQQYDEALNICKAMIEEINEKMKIRSHSDGMCYAPFLYSYLGWFYNEAGGLYKSQKRAKDSTSMYILAHQTLGEIWKAEFDDFDCDLEYVYACKNLTYCSEIEVKSRWKIAIEMMITSSSLLKTCPDLTTISTYKDSYLAYKAIRQYIIDNPGSTNVSLKDHDVLDKQIMSTLQEIDQWAVTNFQHEYKETSVREANGIRKSVASIKAVDSSGLIISTFTGECVFGVIDRNTKNVVTDGVQIIPPRYKFKERDKGSTLIELRFDPQKVGKIPLQLAHIRIYKTVLRVKHLNTKKNGDFYQHTILVALHDETGVWLLDYEGRVDFDLQLSAGDKHGCSISPAYYIFAKKDLGKCNLTVSLPSNLQTSFEITIKNN